MGRELATAVAKSGPEASKLLRKLASTAENAGATNDERAAAITALWPDVQAALDSTGLVEVDEADCLAKKEVKAIFAMSDKEVDGFLAKHPEIRTLRPKTRAGKPHPRRLRVHILDFAKAIGRDSYYANNPLVLQKIQRNMKRAEDNQTLMDACAAFLVPGHQPPPPARDLRTKYRFR
jgi:hypothetical protein